MKSQEIERRVMTQFRRLANESFRVGALAQALLVKSSEIVEAVESSDQLELDRGSGGELPGSWWVKVKDAVRCPHCRGLTHEQGDQLACCACRNQFEPDD